MVVVVSDTTPLHYLILVGQESALEKLYERVFVPAGVLAELGHASAPLQISNWAAKPPAWVIVATPGPIPGRYEGLGFGERQALALAAEIKANLVLLDDKVARRVAQRELMNVKGTLGIVADAARANLLDFVETVEALQRTSMHLDQGFVRQIVEEYKRSKNPERTR
jgi:predicted nucleic acid-binding protein